LLQPGVRDPVFSALLGFVMSDARGDITRDDLARAVSGSGKKTRLPFRKIDRIVRGPGPLPETASVTCRFAGNVKERLPYSVLGYHPGSLRATQESEWREWMLGTVMVSHVSGGRMQPVRLEDVHLWGLMGGEFWIDVDAFVDLLLGDRLDDTRVTGLMLFRQEGKLFGMALGYNREGQGCSGIFSFSDDSVSFPSPDQMKTVARTMRARMEGMLEAEKWEREHRGAR
jgi:hypothetical protein